MKWGNKMHVQVFIAQFFPRNIQIKSNCYLKKTFITVVTENSVAVLLARKKLE